MSLPRVKIEFLNGALGSNTPGDDGVVGLIANGFENYIYETDEKGELILENEEPKVKDTLLKYQKPYLIARLSDLYNLGFNGLEKDEWKKSSMTGEELTEEFKDFENKFEVLKNGELSNEEVVTKIEEFIEDFNDNAEPDNVKILEIRRKVEEVEADDETEEETKFEVSITVRVERRARLKDKNYHIFNTVKDFYKEAPEGTKLWLMVVEPGVTMAKMLDKDETKNGKKVNAAALIEKAKGTINLIITKKLDYEEWEEGYEKKEDDPEFKPIAVTEKDGLDEDVYKAITNAQSLCKWSTETLFAPLFVLLEGRHYTGDVIDLKDLHEGNNNRVGVLIGDTKKGNDACIGLLAGRVAAIPVQRSIARVKSGPIPADDLFIGKETTEDGNPEAIHDKGFIIPRTFVGKAGYYWSDDKLATQISDDYALIPRRRVVDKAYRIAYDVLVDELGEEIPVTDEGKIPAPIVKSIQNKVERAIQNKMTIYGNLGNDPADPNDIGVQCYIDPNQPIMATSRLAISLKVKPHAYAKYIDVELGFKVVGV